MRKVKKEHRGCGLRNMSIYRGSFVFTGWSAGLVHRANKMLICSCLTWSAGFSVTQYGKLKAAVILLGSSLLLATRLLLTLFCLL